MSQLIVEDLEFSRARRPILRGITFDHETGGVLTLLGPSGSGKTTLLWLLAGLLKPDRGRIDFRGSEGDNRVGFVFQDGGLWEHLTARGHLEIVLRGQSLSCRERAERASRVLDETGLSNLADRRPGQLSGGERQRLALARALVIQPQWLLLDEPTSQLDGPSRHELIDLLSERLRSTRAGVILATHQVDLAMRLSDRIVVLLDGQIAQLGAPAEVHERPKNLAVARLLGPAAEISVQDRAVIVRPHQLTFDHDPAGPFTIRSCHFAGGCWLAELRDGERTVWVASDAPIAIGSRGDVHIRP